MMPFIDAAARFVLAVLFNGLWEAAILAAAAWLVLRFMRQGNATTRHSVLAAALFASLILPIVTTVIATMTTRAQPSVTVNITKTNDVAPATRPHQGALPAHRQVGQTPPVAAMPATALRQFHMVVPRLNLTLPRAFALAIVALWLAGAAFVLLRLFRSLFYLEGLKRHSLPVPVEYRSQLVRWSAATKGSREVRLCRSSEVVIPIAVGLFDAMILVPERLLEELAPNEIDQIVLHELAHLRRADDWVNAVERIAQALLFFNPGIAWLVAQLDLEREVACDDWVLQQNDAVPYASCLAKVVETTMWPCPAMSAPGAFVTRRDMSVRIERLLLRHRDVRVRTSLGPIGLAVTAFATLCIAIAFVSPSIAYTTAPVPPTSPTSTVKALKAQACVTGAGCDRCGSPHDGAEARGDGETDPSGDGEGGRAGRYAPESSGSPRAGVENSADDTRCFGRNDGGFQRGFQRGVHRGECRRIRRSVRASCGELAGLYRRTCQRRLHAPYG